MDPVNDHTPDDTSSAVAVNRPARPCDACRKRKSRCEMTEGLSSCVLCQFHHQDCTFKENPKPRKRKISASLEEREEEQAFSSARSPKRNGYASHQPPLIRTNPRIDSYDNFRGPTLLKKTLGLQTHRYATYVGPSSEFEQALLRSMSAGRGDEVPLGHAASLRKVSDQDNFIQHLDDTTLNHNQEIARLDEIETVVAPHGPALIRLYFRIVHPSFPILHKKVWLEKYQRTHREFSPSCLAAVYILALNWWSYSSELAQLPKPDVPKLERLALMSMSEVVHRPKLGTIQAGLLLLQRPEGDSWALTSQLVGIGQDIGLHLDCSRWKIPAWEKNLRKRLSWALFMQDKWGALVHGRPSHLTHSDWLVLPLTESDFPESAADEDDEQGSAEVDKGRLLFCEMVKLTLILSDVLDTFYTLRAQRSVQSLREQLAKAKPIQLRLKEWFASLPEALSMDSVTMRKLSSTGYLHLAYYAVEISLHRCIIASASTSDDSSSNELVQICRAAARTRLVSAMDFVSRLKMEHFQSFWCAPSYYNFAVVATFIVLLWSTSTTTEETAFYHEKLEEYRWVLRVSSKAVTVLDRAISLVTASTGSLVRLMQDKDKRETSYPVDSPEQTDQISSYQQSDAQGFSDEHSISTANSYGAEPFEMFLGNGWAEAAYGAEAFEGGYGNGVLGHGFMPLGLSFSDAG